MTKKKLEIEEKEEKELGVLLFNRIQAFALKTKKSIKRIEVESEMWTDDLDYRPVSKIHVIYE